MDGWMDGWMERQTDGSDGRIDGWIDRWIKNANSYHVQLALCPNYENFPISFQI